ncbi:tRNA adenosine(34) deaminase TadA [Entomomonas moraniae]|uniref:tRNA-specific adenosine deaminase n=1 Tax=Entomomonas moraniae TaxID=2213226 RepID=A0A3Q9JN59_9GAMM|nr:tRNA adenosine(34) deaminase TadA [Entomomonas moraniae]AZS51626.1 tRNA adenosine(34) deaminase TadA [Entomomonas moraniae]
MVKPIVINRAQDLYFMQQAIVLAKEGALLGEVPVGAVVVHNDTIIGRGFNQPITKNDPRAHAEMIAIYEAAQTLQNYRIPDTTLYVTLEPCSMCAGLLVHARIKRLVFGTTEPKAGIITSQDEFFEKSFLNHRPIIEGGVLAEECSNLLKSFFKERRLKQ